MSDDRREKLLHQDWGAAWETLDEAPPLSPRPKTAQITLRLPSSLLARIKRVAAARALPYHALARSWLLEGLRQAHAGVSAEIEQRNDEQLNIKVDQDTLDELKARASELRAPYHRLAREWIEAAAGREEAALGLDPAAAELPGTKDLMVLLLHSTDKSGHEAVRGITRLQKLLFVVEQTVAAHSSRFYAFNFGPFDEGVNDAAKALRLAGFMQGTTTTATAGPPSFAEMMGTAEERAGPRARPDEFQLSEAGHAAAERLRRSSRAYDQLFQMIDNVRKEWDTPDLVERVYETWPKYAERSVIRDEVAERRARRRPK